MSVLNRKESLFTCGYKEDGVPTDSSKLQLETEVSIKRAFFLYSKQSPILRPISKIELRKTRHAEFVLKGINRLAEHWTVLDASKPWLCYWILHSLTLLREPIPDSIAQRAISTLRHMQSPTGGFSGGPGQEPHVAATYAAVNVLAIIGTREAYELIDREKLFEFFMRVKQSGEGSFKMMVGGEIDVRGTYCVLAAATITNLLRPELTEGVAEFIARCQTYEGGIGGYPGVEAHGGYAFCGLAALELLGRTDVLDVDTFAKWSASRQMSLEGGFQGRTNKLVDGCYSFWMGGVFPILGKVLEELGSKEDPADFVYSRVALQEYLLVACQGKLGGMRDKPSKSADFYHTCYCLSGLSASQHQMSYRHDIQDLATGGLRSLLWVDVPDRRCVVGARSNLVEPTHPVLNIRMDKVRSAFIHFYGQPAVDLIEEVDIEVVHI